MTAIKQTIKVVPTLEGKQSFLESKDQKTFVHIVHDITLKSFLRLLFKGTGVTLREAAANARSLDATLLWQEWQTIAQARLLCVDIVEGDRLLRVLHQLCEMVGRRADTSRAALARRDLTLATAAPDFAASQAARSAA